MVIFLVSCSTPTIAPINTTDSKTNTSTGDSVNSTTDVQINLPTITLSDAQKNAMAMLNHLATVTEEIRISKNNKVILEDIYTSLLNEINPGAIDETTQGHLENIREVIGRLLNIQSKREQLQYIHNQQKASAMKEAVPDPLAILSMTNSINWHKFALNTVFTIVDSYNNYQSANSSADQEFILSGWELDDEENKVIEKNRNRAFDYMTDIIQQYGSEEDKKALGKLTLNENAVEDFAKMRAINEVYRKIEILTSKEETYQLFGNYWLELASCYFETKNYTKCLECVKKYDDLKIDIFRKDFNLVPILPKAITAAHEIYTGNEYISALQYYADAIIENANDNDWSVRYFAAQTYMDLYAKTNNREHLESAYKIIKENVNLLIEEQIKLNDTYLGEIPKFTLTVEQIDKLNDKEIKAEQKRIDAYNDSLKTARKTELPPVYEPLVLNCDLLFALGNELQIDSSEQLTVTKILQTETNGVFLNKIINDKYIFNSSNTDFDIELCKDKLIIPVTLLTQGVSITLTVKNENEESKEFKDFTITKVERTDTVVDSFNAHYESKEMQKYKWAINDKITVEIKNSTFCNSVILNYTVKSHKENWIFPDSVVFEKE